MASANASAITTTKVIDLHQYKKKKHEEYINSLKFEVDGVYYNIDSPSIIIHVIGEQTVRSQYSWPKLYICETTTGDVSIVTDDDRLEWEEDDMMNFIHEMDINSDDE